MNQKEYSSQIEDILLKEKSIESTVQSLRERLGNQWKDERFREFDQKYLAMFSDVIQNSVQLLRNYEFRIRQIENKLRN
jgi:hypothetical protein